MRNSKFYRLQLGLHLLRSAPMLCPCALTAPVDTQAAFSAGPCERASGALPNSGKHIASVLQRIPEGELKVCWSTWWFCLAAALVGSGCCCTPVCHTENAA